MSNDYNENESMPPRMGLDLGQYPAVQTSQVYAGSKREPTMIERADMALAQAERRLADMKRAKEILDNNPDLGELLNIMNRSHF